MTMAKNYYEILGVDRDATPDEIKKSFRKLAKKYHPDISKEKDAEARMQEINTAYDTLSHEERKAEYDYALDHPEGAFQGGMVFLISKDFSKVMIFTGSKIFLVVLVLVLVEAFKIEGLRVKTNMHPLKFL